MNAIRWCAPMLVAATLWAAGCTSRGPALPSEGVAAELGFRALADSAVAKGWIAPRQRDTLIARRSPELLARSSELLRSLLARPQLRDSLREEREDVLQRLQGRLPFSAPDGTPSRLRLVTDQQVEQLRELPLAAWYDLDAVAGGAPSGASRAPRLRDELIRLQSQARTNLPGLGARYNDCFRDTTVALAARLELMRHYDAALGRIFAGRLEASIRSDTLRMRVDRDMQPWLERFERARGPS